MNINVRDLDKLNQKGIYCIVNTKNNKVYIGSTTISFEYRFKTHYWRLEANNHENKYLQRSWNKYKKYFIFRVMLVTDNLDFEQRAFNLYKPFGKKGYNLNKKACVPPQNLSKKVIKKRSKTFKKTINKAMTYYYKVKENELLLENVPIKYRKLVNHYINNVPWNKNKKGYTVKYPSKRKNTEEGLKKRKEAFRKLRKGILVYKNNILLFKYNDIEELLLDENIKEHVSLYRSKSGNELKKPNIYNSCRTNKPYKGLLFKFEPS